MNESIGEVDVLLLSMPFGPLSVPSIGLELLRALVPEKGAGPRVEVHYLTLDFASEIGPDLYRDVCTRHFAGTTFVGEWIFGAALAGEEAAATEADEAAAAEAFFRDVGLLETASAEERTAIRRLRAEAGRFLERAAARVLRRRPRIVGFTSTFQQHAASLALARRLKAWAPDLTVLMGGANCEGPMGLETVLSFPFVDAVVSGEAEGVFPTLVERILGGEGVDELQGVYTAANAAGLDGRRPPSASRVRELDRLPRPDYRAFFAQWKAARLETEVEPRLLYETSRGCWWGEHEHCTFCGLNGNSMAFRSKSAERALGELRALVEAHPGRKVLVVDNILDMRYFRDFLPALADSELGVELFYEVKANLRKEQLRQLRSAGVREIQPGIESLSDTVLGIMGKGVRALENVQLLKWCRELGIWPSWHLIWGFPGEPPEDYRRMAEWMPLLAHLPPPGVTARIRLDRFSPNFERAEELGFRDVRPSAAYRHVYADLPPEALANLAYAFDYAYRDGRDPAAYTRPAVEAAEAWQEQHGESSLLHVDRGEELWIWDLRPCAHGALAKLSGLARRLYLACDPVRSLPWLGRHLEEKPISPARLEDELGPLIERGLVLRDGDRVLALSTAGG